MASARFSRREQSRLCRVAQASKVGDDVGEAQRQVPLDILAEDPFGLRLTHDPRDVRPEVPRVGRSAPLARQAERLTGIAGSEEMNAVAQRAAVEGSKIVPDSRLTQGRVRHPRHESRRRVALPLDETNSSISRLGDVEAEIEAGVAGAERDAAEVVRFRDESGRKVHKVSSFRPLDRRSRQGSGASM